MPAEINYKSKYKELKLKFMNSVDIAFRLGFEAGAQQSQQQQAQEQNQQMQQEKLQQQQIEAGGAANEHAPKEDAAALEAKPGESAAPGTSEDANGSELDQHISKLESALGSEQNPEVKKSLEAIVSLRKSEKQAKEMKKSEQAISNIAKALHKPAFKMGIQAAHNLEDNSKKALSMQHKIVNDVMKAWSQEESNAANKLENILNVENLLKE